MNMLENANNAVANVLSFPDPACFDQRWVFGAQIGKDTSNNFALSFNGLAVRTLDNRFVVPKLEGNTAKLIDVTCLTLVGDPFVFRIPVAVQDVRPGDLLIRSDAPFSLLYVEREPLDGRVEGIDPRTEEKVTILPAEKTLDVPALLVKVVSFFEGLGSDSGNAGRGGGRGSALNRELLPLLLCSAQGGVGGLNTNNLALLFLALSKSNRIDPGLLLLLVCSGSQNNSAMQAALLASLSGTGSLFGRATQRPENNAQGRPTTKRPSRKRAG